MITVNKLRRKPKHFHNFTGLSPWQFDELLLALEPLYEQAEKERLENPNRRRSRGAGRNFNLELPERLLMSLMYFRLYLTQTLLGYLFDLDSSNINREINGRMLAGIYRGKPERYDQSALVIAGLNNYRELGKLSWW